MEERHTIKCSGADGLGDDAEDHGELVDDELCAAEVVVGVPHVARLELAPLYVVQVEAPDDGHVGSVGGTGERL